MTLTVAQVSDHCGPKLLPHLGSLVQLVASCAAAAEARVRWAAFYCLGLLADQVGVRVRLRVRVRVEVSANPFPNPTPNQKLAQPEPEPEPEP